MISFLLAAALGLSKTPGGAVRQLPKDTLTVDGIATIGVAVPTTVAFTPGDLNYDGRVSSADLVLMVQNVFQAKPLPTFGPDTLAHQVLDVKNGDSTLYLFVPTRGIKR